MAKFTEEEVEEANSVDILSVCDSNDVPYRMEGNRYARLLDHDSFLIDVRKNTFYWNSRNISGGAIDFVKTYILENNNFRDAVNFLNDNKNFEKHSIEKLVQDPYEYKTQEVQGIDHARNYLKNVRKISDQTINEFHDSGVLVEDKYHNAVFRWLDGSRHNVIGASEQGTHINYEKYGKRGTRKRIQKNSTTDFGCSHVVGKARNLKFFESCIDMMSYRDLHHELKDTLLVSMEGLKPQVVFNYVNRNIEHQQKAPDSVSICVDNDKAGNTFYERMAKFESVCTLDNKDVIFKNEICSEPGCKDYNDELVQKREKMTKTKDKKPNKAIKKAKEQKKRDELTLKKLQKKRQRQMERD